MKDFARPCPEADTNLNSSQPLVFFIQISRGFASMEKLLAGLSITRHRARNLACGFLFVSVCCLALDADRRSHLSLAGLGLRRILPRLPRCRLRRSAGVV